jgi:Xaa-Pro aminopeptidase
MSSYAPYIERRRLLHKALGEAYLGKKGSVVLCAGFEQHRYAFRQESTFYYFTGLEEPATMLLIDPQGASTLFVPQYGTTRSQWVSTIVEADQKVAAQWGMQDIKPKGHPCKGYVAPSACILKEYEYILEELTGRIAQGELLFMVYPPSAATEQKMLIDTLVALNPDLASSIVDISSIVGALRRTKSHDELEMMYEAVDCTMQGLEAASMRIEPGIYEYQLQAAVEFVFKEGGGSPAFPTIVGSGKQSTILHYTANNRQLRSGDLVVVDCGAELGYYCADLTRTFPVSGTFTDRQREVYDCVLEVQQYIADSAAPGYWLNNKEQPTKSLHHLAVAFLKDRGYADYFTHSIGHFIGLDVHDVGAECGPLKVGDVITIEPGIYIPHEMLGVRIEDMYWITDKGAVCISEELPRDSYEIEQMMASELEEIDEL